MVFFINNIIFLNMLFSILSINIIFVNSKEILHDINNNNINNLNININNIELNYNKNLNNIEDFIINRKLILNEDGNEEDNKNIIDSNENNNKKINENEPILGSTFLKEGEKILENRLIRENRTATGGLVNTVLIFLTILAFVGNGAFMIFVFWMNPSLISPLTPNLSK
jgi:hypothetical protein